ncbi:MAG: beta-ketoacyl synthase N-terminal-like domain-containing protein, partial [Pseudohongiella sp.]|nr:beta-ketoacyl synthase N-terminal-like domain-containing protein [Pseudohongiella sp.]
MRRVVVTGIGIVSCIGNDVPTVLESLKEGRSGISYNPVYEEMGLRAHISGRVNISFEDHIDRKHLRFMGDAAAYGYIAMDQAIKDAGL